MKTSRESRVESRRTDRFATSGNACPRHSTLGPRLQRGAFTLLEIMVALFILGLIVAAVYSSWMAVVRGAESGRKAAAEAQRARAVIRELEEKLTTARMFAADLDYYSFIAENGESPTLSFVARLPNSALDARRSGSFDVRRVTFSVEPGREFGPELVMRQTPILMDPATCGDGRIVLATDVRKFEMEFWNVRTSDWTDEWTQTNQLPQLIRITLEFGARTPGSAARHSVTKEIAIPTTTVQPNWQAPGVPVQGPIIRR